MADTFDKSLFRFVCCLSVSIFLASCSGLPSDGPSASDIADQAGAHSQSETLGDFSVVPVDQRVVKSLEEPTEAGLVDLFGNDQAPTQELIKAGDYVIVTIWEADAGAFFSGSGASVSPSQTSLGTISSVPEQPVLRDGTIVIPYAGRIKIANRTPGEAENLIGAALRNKASNPQVLMTVTHGYSNQVTVTGDAVKSALVTLTANSGRILDVLAATGGTVVPSNNVRVQVERGDRSETMDLEALLHKSTENIRLVPGDTIIFSKTERRFTALGALGKVASVPFETNHVSLAQAIGDAGGLLDERADPSGVFVFRFEPRDRASKVCQRCVSAGDAQYFPIAYRLDMSKADSYFLAQSFAMQDRDVLFVANAEKVELQKLLAMIRDLTSPILTGAVVTRAVSH